MLQYVKYGLLSIFAGLMYGGFDQCMGMGAGTLNRVEYTSWIFTDVHLVEFGFLRIELDVI